MKEIYREVAKDAKGNLSLLLLTEESSTLLRDLRALAVPALWLRLIRIKDL
jgi:hypothetical protein